MAEEETTTTTKPTKSKVKGKEACELKGGVWDEATQNCTFPASETGPNTAKQSVETPKGTFVGINKPDTELLKQQLDPQVPGQAPITQVAPLGTAQASQTEAAAREAQVAGTGVLEQTAPTVAEQDISIAPTGVPGEDFPIAGPSLGALEALRQARQKEQQLFNAKGELNTAIEKQGLTASERFGVYVEAIPLVGKLADEYVQGLDTPTDNIRDIVTTINGIREAAEFQATQAASGKVDPNTALKTIIEIQDRVEAMESRLKYLIQFSTVLRTSSDEVNKIEVEIFRTKQKLFIAAQTAASGAVTEPSEMDIFQTLDDVRKRQ